MKEERKKCQNQKLLRKLIITTTPTTTQIVSLIRHIELCSTKVDFLVVTYTVYEWNSSLHFNLLTIDFLSKMSIMTLFVKFLGTVAYQRN